MSELGSMRPEDRKTIEEYLRRYEDQTLKALESHSNAFGQALLAAYLLFRPTSSYTTRATLNGIGYP